MLKKEKCIHSEYVYRGKILSVRVEEVEVQNGHTAKREIVEHCGGVCVVAVDDAGKAYLVRQYRRPLDDFLLELPAGKLEAEEDSLEGAKRELREETGFTAEKFVFLGADYVSPGYCCEKIYVYLALGLTAGEMQPDGDEFVEVYSYPLDTLVDMVMDGTLYDAKTVIGILKAKKYLENKGGRKA